MKTLRTTFFIAAVFFSLQAFAQIPSGNFAFTTKRLATYPASLAADTSKLSLLFSKVPGAIVQLKLGTILTEGKILAVTSRPDNQYNSVVVQLTALPEATLFYSRAAAGDGTNKYAASIVSRQSGDLYQMIQEGNTIVFRKNNTRNTILD